MNPVIVIPSYWARNDRGARTTEPGVYDHATPLNATEPELARCLDSLEPVRGITRVIVLLVASNDDEPEARARVEEICSQHSRLNPFVVSAAESWVIQTALAQISPDLDGDTVSLRGYGAIKNMGLLVAAVLGHDAVVFLDDDEIITSPEFLVDAVYGLGHMTRQDLPVIAKTGYFLNQDDSPYATAVSPAWYDRWWNKRPLFNMWMNRALNTTRISRSNILTGGCFSLHAEAFTRVGFDPYITRGEDLDYLLDLRMYGFDVWFDNQWCVVHRPPNTPSRAGRFEQDVYRWIYQQEKLRTANTIIGLHQVTAESLMPYPGPWLSDELDGRIAKTAFFRALFYEEHEAYLHILTRGRKDAYAYAAAHAQSYLKFQTYWPQVMVELWNDERLARRLYRAPQIVREEQERRYGYPSDGEVEGSEPVDWIPQVEEPAGGSSIPAFFPRTQVEEQDEVDPAREERQAQMASFLEEVRSSTEGAGAPSRRPTQEQPAEEHDELPAFEAEGDEPDVETDEQDAGAPSEGEPAESTDLESTEAQVDEGVSQSDTETGTQLESDEEAVVPAVEHSEEQEATAEQAPSESFPDEEEASLVPADVDEQEDTQDGGEPEAEEAAEIPEAQEAADADDPHQEHADHDEEAPRDTAEPEEVESVVLPAVEAPDADEAPEDQAQAPAESQSQPQAAEDEVVAQSEENQEEDPVSEPRPREEYVVPEYLQVPVLEITVELPDFLKRLEETLGSEKTGVLERRPVDAVPHDPDLSPDAVGYELVVEPQSAIPAHEPLDLAAELEAASSEENTQSSNPAVPAFLLSDDIMPTMPLSREEIEAALQRSLATMEKADAQEIVDLIVDDDLQEQLEQGEESPVPSGEDPAAEAASVEALADPEESGASEEPPAAPTETDLDPTARDDAAASADGVAPDDPSLGDASDAPAEETEHAPEELAENEGPDAAEQEEAAATSTEDLGLPEDADDAQDAVEQDVADADAPNPSAESEQGDDEAIDESAEPKDSADEPAAEPAESEPAADEPAAEPAESESTDEPEAEQEDATDEPETADAEPSDDAEDSSAESAPADEEPAERPKSPYQLRRERMNAVLDEMGDRRGRSARRPKVLPKPKTKTYLTKREPEITSVSVLESFAQAQDEVQMVQQPPQPPEFFVNDLAHDEPDTNRGDVQLLGPFDLMANDAHAQESPAAGSLAEADGQELAEEKSSSRSFPIIQPPLSLPDHPEDDV